MKTKLWLNLVFVFIFMFALALPVMAVEQPNLTVQSDTLTEWSSDGITYSNFAVECFEHNGWFDTGIDDVSWIWRTEVTNPNLEFQTVPEGGWYFRRIFELPENAMITAATLYSNCDNAYIVFINGEQILSQGTMAKDGPDMQDFKTLETNLITNLQPGTNSIIIRAMNHFSSVEGTKTNQPMYGDGYQNPAGLIFKLDVYYDEPQLYNICGFKLDADTGMGLEGWEIILRGTEGTVIDTHTTDANGKYCFTGLEAGNYTVEEVLQKGWEPVDPASGIHEITLPNNSIIYGIQRETGKIYEVDPMFPDSATLYKQIVAADTNKTFSGTSPNGIAYDQETGDIYFATFPSPSRLYKFQGDVQRDLGQLTGSVASGEFFNGKYYYIADTTDDLYVVTFKEDGTIDSITPHVNISSGVSAWYFGDIVVDHTEGVIYGEGQNLNTNKQEFFKVNLDGSGYLRIDADVFTNLLQLAIGTDNELYAHSAFLGTFYTIDRMTGDITNVSTGTNLYTDISSASTFYNFENQTTLGNVPAFKFYDVNLNGTFDQGESPIEGWKIEIWAGTELKDTKFTNVEGLVNFSVPYGSYTIKEIMPNDFWMATTPTQLVIDVERGETADQAMFGNICLGVGGGKTLGFWSNKNGLKQILTEDFTMLENLNLVEHDGTAYVPDSNNFNPWLLDSNATNMARMLSAQLAAMELNVSKSLVNINALIYAPGTTSANTAGFATISDVMNEANTELGYHTVTLADSPYRAYQEALKNALDRANNNLNFVQTGPCLPITY